MVHLWPVQPGLAAEAEAPDSLPAFSGWVAEALHSRDASHGIEHSERVRALAVQIAEAEASSLELLRSETFCPWKVVQLAALAHDLFDHKYCDEAQQRRGAQDLRQQLHHLAGASAEEVEAVLLVMENISYSKEKCGKLDFGALRARGWELLRDIVSDADKIDALGEDGLGRCYAYARHVHAELGDDEVTELVKEHCNEKLLHLTERYIRTSAGKALARPGHKVIARFVGL